MKYNLEITSKNNLVYLVGDESVKFLKNLNKNIIFVDIKKYANSQKIEKYRNKFKNYSTNSFEFEWFCFARIFILEKFLKDFGLNEIFYIDSDNILLVDVRNLEFTSNCAYSIPNTQENYRHSASIHSSLIDVKFCYEFEKLFYQIYVTRDKHSLIDKKIEYHQKNNVIGGINDMTLNYLLNAENIIKPQNLLETIRYKGNPSYIFMNNFNTAEGLNKLDSYEIKNGKMKIYNRDSILDMYLNQKLKICNIHFQGGAKKYLNRFTKYKVKY